MKKILLLLGLTITLLTGYLVVHQQSASAATPWQIDYWNHYCSVGAFGGGCKGYFTGTEPGCVPNICNIYNVLTTGVNVTGAATGCGTGTACDAFIQTYQTALFSGGPGQESCGAAFVINAMLGHGPFNSSCAAGIAAAKGGGNATFNQWKALVQSYADSTNSAYGVQWNTLQNPTINSSWWANNSGYPNDVSDDVSHANIWHCDVNGCGGAYRDDESTGWVWKTVNVPIAVIRFYFPGGSFLIERACSNLVGTVKPIPAIPVNHVPTGTISLTCDATLEQQVATVTFNDTDGATTGYITAGTWTSGTSASPGPTKITIPQSAVSPYTAQLVSLHVKDTGQSGTQQYQIVASANTNVPCVTLACGSMNITPARLDPYMSFSVDTNVTNNVNMTPPGATMTLKIIPPTGATYTYTHTQNATGAGAVSTATFPGVGPTNAAGVYTASWTFQGGAATKTCTSTFPVVYLPYMSVFGGDVSIGASPSNAAGACATNNSAGIYSWNNHTTDFSGGGAQYAVQALSAIVDFSSAQSSSSAAPAGLSFANYFNPANTARLNTPQGLFGGYAAASSADCDFTSDISSAPITSDTTIGATTVAPGTEKIYYVENADVYITGNIVYGGSGSWNATQIPYFKLVVVNGNIYVGSNVTELDGIYVAEPNANQGGGIYTCAAGLRAPADPTKPGYYATCNKQLVINGAFIASQVHFLRTYGSLGQAKSTDTISSNHSGEVFNYSPEVWLPRAGVVPNSSYTAITGLPPVL